MAFAFTYNDIYKTIVSDFLDTFRCYNLMVW